MRFAYVAVVFAALAHVGYSAAAANCVADKELADGGTNVKIDDGAADMDKDDMKCAAGTGFTGTAETLTNTGEMTGAGGGPAGITVWKGLCCSACHAGDALTFTNEAGRIACKSCDADPSVVCVAGQRASTACSANAPRVCQACGDNEYQLAAALTANPDKNDCETCTNITGDNCAGAAADPITHYRFNTGCADKEKDAECKACTACEAGKKVKVACTATADTQCEACADGTFNADNDNGSATTTCEAHKDCAAEGGVKTAGTASAQAVCSPAAKLVTGITSLFAVLLLLL